MFTQVLCFSNACSGYGPSSFNRKNSCFPNDEHAPITFLVGLDLSVETYPKDSVTDPKAYLEAIAAFLPGDAVTIFTPDDTHFEIALAAIQRGEYVESSFSSRWTVLIDHRLMSLASVKEFRT
jgi:hypothetical protein